MRGWFGLVKFGPCLLSTPLQKRSGAAAQISVPLSVVQHEGRFTSSIRLLDFQIKI